MNEENICPWIISDRLPYPVGGIRPVIGRIIYENIFESSSALQMYSYGSSIVVFQGLTNATLKLVSDECLEERNHQQQNHFTAGFIRYTFEY